MPMLPTTKRKDQIESINLETLDQAQNFLVVVVERPSTTTTTASSRRRRKQQQQHHQQQQQQQQQWCVVSIRLSSKLFGNPTNNNNNSSLSLVQRRQLFEKIGSDYCRLGKLHSLIIEGTNTGQVLPGELIALSLLTTSEEEEEVILPPSPLPPIIQQTYYRYAGIQVLEIHSGLVLNTMSDSVLDLAVAIQGCRHTLRRVCLRNFLNHVRPLSTNNIALLDPILQSLSSSSSPPSHRNTSSLTTTTTASQASSSSSSSVLEYLEISCLASMVNWKRPLISDTVFGDFMKSCRDSMQHLELTNLGLEDKHINTLISASSSTNAATTTTTTPSSPLQELIWNANENTIAGISTIIENMAVVIGSKNGNNNNNSNETTKTRAAHKNHPILCNLKRLSIINNVKLNQIVFDILYSNVLKVQRYHRRRSGGGLSLLLQYFDCTLPLSQQDYYRSCIDPYLKIHRLPIREYYFFDDENNDDIIGNSNNTISTVEACIDNIIIPASKDNDLTVLYLLLRDKPTLCDVAKNGSMPLNTPQYQAGGKTTKTSRIIMMTLILILFLILFLREYGYCHPFIGGYVSTTTTITGTSHHDL